MDGEKYEPRDEDHFVEPMFAGLGVGEGEQEEKGGLFSRCFGALRRLLRRDRSGVGRPPR